MGDRYPAMIDGFALDVETLSDGFEKAIARYEYPYRDGAELEDMGQTARRIRIRCFFLEDRYQDHYDFLSHLKSRELFELSHPKYGLVNGCIQQVMVRHDDRLETAEVDIDFVQDLLSQETPIVAPDLAAEVEESFISGQQELMDAFATEAVGELGSEAAGILSTELDPDLGILEQFSGVSTKARAWLKSVETFVATVQAEAIDVANSANSLLAMIDYGAQLPGRVIGALARTVERYALLHNSVKSAPERYLQNLQNSTDDLADSLTKFAGLTRVAGAQRQAVEAADIYAADEQVRDRQRRRENLQTAFDVAGNYLAPEQVEPVLTVRQLEQSLALVRTALQAGLDTDRSQVSLKAMARALMEHVMVVKLERDRLVRITLDNPMPLHLVCQMRGLPYAYAERILAVNAIVHPNFTDGEVDVYVR